MLPGVVRCCGSCARSACWRPRQRPARAGRVRRSASRRHRHEDSDDRNVGNAPLALKGRGWQLADAAFAFPVAPDCMLATLVPGANFVSTKGQSDDSQVDELITAIKAEIARIEKEQLKKRAANGRKAKKTKATS